MNAKNTARTHIQNQQTGKELRNFTHNSNGVTSSSNDDFNFEAWAVAVKQQMIAVLHKKEYRRSRRTTSTPTPSSFSSAMGQT